MMSLQGSLTVEHMCRWAQVSRAGFYRALRHDEPMEEQMEVRAAIHDIALQHRRRYGSRRIAQELRHRGLCVNRKRVVRIMQADNLLAVPSRRFIFTTESSHDLEVYLNLAGRMKLTGINQLWVADITYIRLRREFVYLALILDVFSRKVVGWALERSLQARLAIGALHRAIADRQPPPGLVHHSDRGVQYACADYLALLQEREMIPSMSRPANPYDNAFCESFIKTLKREEIYANRYHDLEDLRVRLEEFIERYYNRLRLHSALGYLSPEAFEARQSSRADDVSLGASLSFFRHREVFPSDAKQIEEAGEPSLATPQLIGVDETPAGYSLASCSPAELASASPADEHRPANDEVSR
jgi:transposase InsO family protein